MYLRKIKLKKKLKNFFLKMLFIIFSFFITFISSKSCSDTYSCFNQGSLCKAQITACLSDQGCVSVLTAPDSCTYDCTKDCLKNPAMAFPYTCFSNCIPQKNNAKYTDLMTCKLSACAEKDNPQPSPQPQPQPTPQPKPSDPSVVPQPSNNNGTNNSTGRESSFSDLLKNFALIFVLIFSMILHY